MIYLSTWMYEETDADGGHYAQVGGPASSESKRMVYWRCVLVFYALAHQHTQHRSDVRLIFFTNAKTLPIVNGVDLAAFLASLGVSVVQMDYRWRPHFPKKAWYNQFYVFDILDHFEIHASPDDFFIVADSDCLATQSLDPMFECLVRDGYLTIDVETQPDEDINGISPHRGRRDLRSAWRN